MIGSGWLFSPFISAQMAGSNALVSWILAALFMLLIALPLCELGAMLPIAGGMANYPSFTHGKEVGFIFAWTAWLSYVVMTPIEIQAILQYSSHFFPGLMRQHTGANLQLSAYGYVTAIGIMFFVVVLNSFGIKLLAEANKYTSILKFLLPGIAIVALLHTAPTFENIHIEVSHALNWEQIFSALSVGGVIFAFTGFQNGLVLAGEVKNPQRNVPIAILGAVLIGFVLYFMLQLAFIAAVPQKYLAGGWHNLSFPGESGPLVGLTLLLGLGVVAMLLLFDAAFSPFGTTLVYTAATSRILYGMAVQGHVPKFFLTLNKHKIPYITLYANFFAGTLVFLPFPGWQKMVAFLSSTSILSYGIGPICLLALRTLSPNTPRPFKLAASTFFCHAAFYACNLMLYWCGFSNLWKLYIAIWIGILISLFQQRSHFFQRMAKINWFLGYMTALLVLSYLGSFGGINLLLFPYDLYLLLPFSIGMLYLSQRCLIGSAIEMDQGDGIIQASPQPVLQENS